MASFDKRSWKKLHPNKKSKIANLKKNKTNHRKLLIFKIHKAIDFQILFLNKISKTKFKMYFFKLRCALLF